MKTEIPCTVLSDCGSRRPYPSATRRKFRPVLKHLCLAALFLSATLLCGAETPKNSKNKKKPGHVAVAAAVVHPVVVKVSDARVAPIPPSDKVISYHAPYDAGDCSICHQNNDVQNPGAIKGEANDLCLSCHDNLKEALARKYPHPAAQMGCLNCHNPHDSKQPHLLLDNAANLCFGCHDEIKKAALDSPVKHDALTQGKQCLNCHNPHGSDVEHLLVQLPMQLCMQCHGKDGVVDHNGKKLINMATLLAENSHQHAPVAAQDCSACHMPHGSENFRLLTNAYPAKFYSAYDAKNYALCFGCHDEKAFTTPETEELTQFRNGKKNLHYVHVHKDVMGRTCRACHDVHAAPQEHQIRDGVPFGSSGWMLKLNYTRTETGGSCAKTCHQTRSYNNSRLRADAPAAAPQPAAPAAETKPATETKPAAPAAETKTAATAAQPKAVTEANHDAKP